MSNHCYSLFTLPRAGLRKQWCAACGLVLRLCCPICAHSNAIRVEKGDTGRSDSMCHHDLVRNGFYRPVLKHGPRSLTSMRVFGCQTLMRNESKGRLVSAEVGILCQKREALSTDRHL